MAFDSITNSTSNPKEFAKKKKANRSAKLKQCKLDARRQQWLSQVKNKGSKEEADVDGEIRNSPIRGRNERDRVVKILEIDPQTGENDGSVHHYSDSDSSSHSPTSHSSSVVGSSGSSFTASASSSRSSNSSSSGRSYSGNISEEEDDDCLDDWEAVADALAATDDKQQQEQLKANQESTPEHESIAQSDSQSELAKGELAVDMSEPKVAIRRAWRPDDAFRPQSLPSLFKQNSFPMKLDRRGGHGGMAWACSNGISTPSSCPICCEDLDFTDSSFLPCSCGFRLCLFCHKRILEEDGRCPGCRKKYEQDAARGEGNANFVEGSPPLRLARSYSMITRS